MRAGTRMNYKLSPKRWAKLILLVCCTCIFALLAADIRGDYITAGIDAGVYRWMQSFRSGFATGFFKVMTNMVHPVVMLVISISMIHVVRQTKYLLALFGNLALTVFLNLAIKGSFMRVRPPEAMRLVTESGYSFPSGHAMLAASFYGFLLFMLLQTEITAWQKVGGAIGCIGIILLIGMSRIYLGVHYTTDVIGGFLVSTIYLILYTRLLKWYFEAEIPKRETVWFLTNQRLFHSMKHALDGIRAGLVNEPNMMIHFCAAVVVIVFGLTIKLTILEWSICLILCGLVIALELMNTAVEAVVDLVTKDFDKQAKLAKDTAAGAVLVAAIVAAVVGGLIFVPKIILLFQGG